MMQKTERAGNDATVRVRSDDDLFIALRHRTQLDDVVPIVLDVLETDPLASAGHFPGDLLRALIELPAEFWRHRNTSFHRYQEAVRAGAIARRGLPVSERMRFWTELES